MSEAYRQAGVNLSSGYETVRRIKPHVERTRRKEVLGSLGGFGGLFEIPWERYTQPVLVSGTDGVGTKLKLAFELDQHDTIGIDLVAMCANDIVVSGAEPLFFLDYLACGKLDPDQAEAVVAGIAEGCLAAGCALVGGETAEMPGFYPEGEYDLAGFCVGIVEKEKLITGERIQPGDVLIGLASSGVHSNGFSLVRCVLQKAGVSLNEVVPEVDPERPLGQVLLEPTPPGISSRCSGSLDKIAAYIRHFPQLISTAYYGDRAVKRRPRIRGVDLRLRRSEPSGCPSGGKGQEVSIIDI